ncbi:hypothetical protein [Flavobacterium silvaticum]|uniref:Uncharacterized protein n=1 Tax=Flavobacterium silvaticum TaxID=1852020 RepID=A0A972JH88_9FLAO|nr:hypothetical protein [Flavobacterium silvaticum]NMH26863.1 hypothetical protein [Flavobacterium silvaticum]
MKTTSLTIIAALLAFGVQAQQKNVQNASTTTVTTVKDSDGEKKLVKTTTEQQSQDLKFQDPDSKALNKDLAPTPTEVTATTTVTLPDGSTRLVDVDRSAVYDVGGKKVKVVLDNVGYSVIDVVSMKKVATLRNVGNNQYLYNSDGKTSYVSFDGSGNLVMHTYDPKSDKITTQTYTKN